MIGKAMETNTPTSGRYRDLLATSATMGTMLFVTGSAKVGYGLWALGGTALLCIVYRAGSYLVADAGLLRLRGRLAGRFRRMREFEPVGPAIVAGSAARTMVPSHDCSQA